MLIYPVILHKTDDVIPYFVEVPDLGAMTQGKDLENAIEMAREIICISVIEREKAGESIPSASELTLVKSDDANVIVTLVDADADAYKRRMENRCTRKNCTIPIWLNDEAEKAGINFSSALQQGLKMALGIED